MNGNFVEIIENKCEEWRIRDIKDDYYTRKKQYALVGATSHNYYSGIYVKVKMQI
jgi:hypothetical protein